LTAPYIFLGSTTLPPFFRHAWGAADVDEPLSLAVVRALAGVSCAVAPAHPSPFSCRRRDQRRSARHRGELTPAAVV